jgi:hypothetical protein
VFGNSTVQVALSVLSVLVLLLSSSDLSNLRLPSAHFSTASGGLPSSANATGYLPYLLNASAFPLPSPLLNGSGGATLPQLTMAPSSAASVYELAYVQTSYEGMNNLSVVTGTYNTTLGVRAYTGSGCGGPCPRVPIEWGTPVVVAKFGKVNVTGDAIAANGPLVAIAAAFGTKTTVWLSGDYGGAGTWTNLTAPHGLLIGGSPRLALIPCGLIATTIASAALYVSTFPFTCHYTPNSPTVGNGGGTHGPSPPVPTVTSVIPNYGSRLTVVNLTGTNYAGGATAYFGGTTALATTVLSGTKILATAPTGSGVVHITVTSGGYTSNGTCADLFTYGNFAGSPTISTVSPAQGPPGQLVTLTGSGFTNGPLTAVTFGGVSAQIVNVMPTQVQAIAPAGNGTVYVSATVNGKTSLQTCATEYTFNPGTPPPNSAALPPAITAYPAWITGGTQPVVGILASNSSNSEIRFYNSTNNGMSYNASNVEPFNNSLGSSVFSAIGGTRLVVATGQSGQTAFAAEGPQLFGLFTSRVQGRTAVETVASTDSGRTWTGPYLTSSAQGAILDPEAATSPAGYAYATWRENGAGPWQVDEAVFSFDGKALQLPTTIASSGGLLGIPAGPPTLAVDNFQRPLYVWSAWNNTTRMFELRNTGGFLTPKVATQTLRMAWNATVPADFLPVSSGTLGFFKANVNGSIVNLQTAIASTNSKRLCWSWTNLSRYVYPNVTSGDPAPFLAAPGPSVSGCSTTPTPGTDVSKVAPTAGPFAANVYLYVYSDWISEALGYGTLPTPNWAGSPLTGLVNVVVTPPAGGSGSPFILGLGGNASDSQGDTAMVASTTINPNTLWLNATNQFAGKFASATITLPVQGGGWQSCGGWNTTDQIHSVSVTVTVINASGHKFSGTFTNPFRLPSVWVTNLSARENGSWWENVSLTFQEWHSSDNTCTGQRTSAAVTPITPGWPSNSVLRLKGTFTTGLSFDPWKPSLPLIVQTVVDPKNSSRADDSIHWNNTIWANATAWNNESYCGSGCTPYADHNNSSAFQTPENLGFKSQPISSLYPYQVYTIVQSHPGGYTGAWPTTQTLNSAEVVASPIVETGTASCAYYQLANPVHIGLPSPGVTHVTDTSATVTWLSDQNGSGWLAYNDTWEAQFSQTATELSSGNTTFPYAYEVELRGLRPWGVYQATLGVGAFAGCLEYLNTTHILFQTLTQAALSEYDSPYDSITQQGGGSSIQWQEPAGFSAISRYTNGSLRYFPTNNASASVTVPLPSIWLVEADGSLGTTMGANLTGLTVNLHYNVTLSLNYSVRPPSGHGTWLPLWVGSKAFIFWYEKDTSGDGLTDWEKLRGWEVTSQDAWGSWQYKWVTANPSLYATNGLTGDYQEKLYGLDPRTVDSAASHMLDTWNLTFDLGPKTSTLKVPIGANFRYWYEAGSLSSDYNWTRACQYYPGPGTSCAKGQINGPWSNITGADSWAWASRVLWSRTALTTFINMSGVQNASWLRGTLGNSSSEWTLTVEGKLSWAANPLAASTPRDGIADGARVNPLYDEDLLISSLSASLSSCPTPPSGGAYGWATLFYLNWSTSPGPHELPAGGNYSVATLDTTSSCGSIANYRVPIPVNGTSQNQSLQVRVILNQSSSPTSTVLKAAKVSGTATKVSITYDAVWGKPKPYGPYSGSGSGIVVGSLGFNLSVVPAGVKNNTLIWLPTDNSTLNNLPWGLKRYTGEQGFDLVVVNLQAASSISSYYIPYAQNSSDLYRVTLSPGLNNLLIPRGQFLYSPLGQAILLNKNTSWTNASAKPSLLNTNENNTINSYGSSNPLKNLACYWQNRAVNNNASGTSGAICSTETGTAMGNSKGLVVVASTSASGVNTGGVPANPSLENASEEGAALQSIATLNISSQTGLNLLLAALLDNTTGGVNGTFLPVTFLIPSLGLSSVVTEELANATQSSSGLFGVPWGIVPPPPPPPPCNSLWCYATNLVSGIVSVAGQFFSYVWTAAVAASQFINDHLPTWLKSLGEQIAQRTAAALAYAGSLMAQAWNLLLSAVEQAVSALLNSVLSPILNTIDSYVSGLNSTFTLGRGDVNGGGSVTYAHQQAFLNSIVATPFLMLGGLSTAITVGLFMLSPFAVGAGFLISILTPLILGAIRGPWTNFPYATLLGTTGLNPTYVGGVYSAFSGFSLPVSSDSTGATTLSDEIGIGTGVISAILAGIGVAIAKKAPGVAEVIGFILGGLGLIISEWSLRNHTHNLDLLSLCLSGLAFLLGIPNFRGPLPTVLIDSAVFILGAVGLALVMFFGA